MTVMKATSVAQATLIDDPDHELLTLSLQPSKAAVLLLQLSGEVSLKVSDYIL
jgi:hypothetical protein